MSTKRRFNENLGKQAQQSCEKLFLLLNNHTVMKALGKRTGPPLFPLIPLSLHSKRVNYMLYTHSCFPYSLRVQAAIVLLIFRLEVNSANEISQRPSCGWIQSNSNTTEILNGIIYHEEIHSFNFPSDIQHIFLSDTFSGRQTKTIIREIRKACSDGREAKAKFCAIRTKVR